MGADRVSGLFPRTGDVRGRMAGAGRGSPSPAGSRDPTPLRGRSAARPSKSAHRSWQGLAFVLAIISIGDAHAQVLSSRIWPARDYTRLTLESKVAIKHSLFSLKDPERLVLDLETEEMSSALAELQGKVAEEDPYIKGLRVARNRP